MGFAKFLSPRRIKLARGTARNFKLELAAQIRRNLALHWSACALQEFWI
ncbi:hypothetical protein CAMGR0001_2252 [Campylobacter gracilis RM3268]|uniref:Uncharacterized protein n=1 Tax=Campylobacter gracilis RM3268 TaxID=553220 RepID=C8PH64_9BACT|nr:hypothetical protein CAMGR0001_2252 [Campylobacter gracilis RM3268]